MDESWNRLYIACKQNRKKQVELHNSSYPYNIDILYGIGLEQPNYNFVKVDKDQIIRFPFMISFLLLVSSFICPNIGTPN